MNSQLYTSSFDSYTDTQKIQEKIQRKMDTIGVDDNVFASVDYSSGYDSLIDSFNKEVEEAKQEAENESSSNGSNSNSSSGNNNSSTGDAPSLEEGGTKATAEDIAQLRAQYEDVQESKGIVNKAIDGIANLFNTKNSPDKVKEVIDKAEAGEMSLEEAQARLSKMQQKAESNVDTAANVLSGVAATAGLLVAGPLGAAAGIAVGAAIGGVVKAGINVLDKATNDVEGDIKAKDIAKDAITGAVGGAVTVATAGMGNAALTATGGKVVVSQAIKAGAIAGAKAGAVDGAVMAATDYTVEAVFEEDVDFKFGELAKQTVTGAATGAVIGGTIGGLTSGMKANKYNKTTNAIETKAAQLDDLTKKATSPDDAHKIVDAQKADLDKQIKELTDKGADKLTRAEKLKLEKLNQKKALLEAESAAIDSDYATYQKNINKEIAGKNGKGGLQAEIADLEKTQTKLDVVNADKELGIKDDMLVDDKQLKALKDIKAEKLTSQDMSNLDDILEKRNNLRSRLNEITDDSAVTKQAKEAYEQQLKEIDNTLAKLEKAGVIEKDSSDLFNITQAAEKQAEDIEEALRSLCDQNYTLSDYDAFGQEFMDAAKKMDEEFANLTYAEINSGKASNSIKKLKDAISNVDLSKLDNDEKAELEMLEAWIDEYETLISKKTLNETTEKTFGEMAQGAADATTNAWKKGMDTLKDAIETGKEMKPSDITKALTGKTNATKDEINKAVEAFKKSGDWKNLELRKVILEWYEGQELENVA